MQDKEFLTRVEIAWEVYKKQVNSSIDIENFITWLYNQYGIIKQQSKDNK